MNNSQANKTRHKRFNIVDIAIIAILILIVLGIGWKLIGAKSSAEKEAESQQTLAEDDVFARLRFVVACPNVPTDAAKNAAASKQKQVFNSNQKLDAYVTECHYEVNSYTVTEDEDTQYTVTQDDLCTAYFTVEARYDENTYNESAENEIFSVGTQEIRVGKGYVMKTSDYEFTGYVTHE